MDQEQKKKMEEYSPKGNILLVNLFRTYIVPMIMGHFLMSYNIKFVTATGLTRDFVYLVALNVMIGLGTFFLNNNLVKDHITYFTFNVPNKISRLLQYVFNVFLFTIYIILLMFQYMLIILSIICVILMIFFGAFWAQNKMSITQGAVEPIILFIFCMLISNWFFNKANGEYLNSFYRDVSQWRRDKDKKLIEYQKKDDFPLKYVDWKVDFSDRVPSVIYFLRPIFIYSGRYLVNALIFLGKKFKAQRLVVVIRAIYFAIDCLLSGLINFFVYMYQAIFFLCRFSVFAFSNIAFIICLAFSAWNLYVGFHHGGMNHLAQSCLYTALGILIWQSFDLIYLNLKRGY